MGTSDIESTFLLRSRGLLMATPSETTDAWSPQIGDSVRLVSAAGEAFELKVKALELALPAGGGPCTFSVGLASPSGQLQDLVEIEKALTSKPGHRVAVEWGSTSSTG